MINVSLGDVACVAGGFVGDRTQATIPRNFAARLRGFAARSLARARSPTKPPATQAMGDDGKSILHTYLLLGVHPKVVTVVSRKENVYGQSHLNILTHGQNRA